MDAVQVAACLDRIRSDIDFQTPVHKEYKLLIRLHEVYELSVNTDKAKLKDFLHF